MAERRSNMQTTDLFTCTCLALALNRREAGILETLLSDDAVFVHSTKNQRLEGKEAILAFFRIWFHTLTISLEAGTTSFNAALAKVKEKNKEQCCLLVRQNVRGGTNRFLSLCLSCDGLINTIEFRLVVPDSLEELNIFPI